MQQMLDNVAPGAQPQTGEKCNFHKPQAITNYNDSHTTHKATR